ncbi:MAG: DUF5615 family PIN-like protein [Cyanobacteria bacterium J06555_13]
MPERIKFHTDENVGNSIAKGLSRRGIDVTTTPNANLVGASDEEQLAFSVTEGRVIFTQDADFLRLHQRSKLHPGIVYCSKNSRSTGEIIETLCLIWACMTPEEMAKRVEFI